MNTFCQRLLNRLAPEGYEDESGFHYGPEQEVRGQRTEVRYPTSDLRLPTTELRPLAFFLAFSLPATAQTNALFIGAPASSCVLAWNYSAAETHSNLSFTVYTSPSLSIPHTNWIAVTNFSSLSNSITTGSNLQFTVRVPVWHGAQFWTATADDSFWGKSFFAQPAWTNPLPRLDNPLKISR